MIDRIFSIEKGESHLILGPRGVGKSSWLTANFKQSLFFDLLDDNILYDFRNDPTLLSKRIPDDYTGPVIIDEVQKAPSLLDEVHRIIEQRKKKPIWFLLTGSSARKLKRQGVNLLAGRALYRKFYPFIAEELGINFNLKKALRYGMLPTVWNHKNPEAYLKSYVMTYIDQEVKLEGLSRNIPEFNRFLQAASFSVGQPLNISSVAADCSIGRRTVTNYFEILEDILLATRLPVFSRRAKRKLIQRDKFFFFDCGVFSTLRPRGPLDSDSELLGAAAETLVLQHIQAANEHQQLGYEIYYWRTRDHIEVDLILYGKKGFKAIEVKSSSRIRESDYVGLSEFKNDYPEAKCLMIYGGDKEYHQSGVEIIPLEKFLLNMKKYIG